MHGLDIVNGSDEWHVYTSKIDFLESLKVVMMIHSPRHRGGRGGISVTLVHTVTE